MKIVMISDTHGQHKNIKVPAGDLLIHAGDLTMSGRRSDYDSVGEWFQKLNFPLGIIAIAGNHDFNVQYFKEQVLPALNVTYLENSGVTIDGVKFWGSPYTPEFGRWAFMLPRNGDELQECWAKIPDDINVLITHGPIYGVRDITADGVNAGCKLLKARAFELTTLKLHVFGHIHEAAGCTIVSNTQRTVSHVNASVLDENYQHNEMAIETYDWPLA